MHILATFLVLLNIVLLANGFALVTHESAKLFFIIFHIVVVIMIIK